MPVEPTSQQPRRVLVVAESVGAAADLLPALERGGSVRVVTTTADALAALRDEHFDWVTCTAAELLPLARASSRERAGSILEGVAQGVCIIGRDGQLVWANAATRAYPADVVEAIRQTCAMLLEDLAADTTPATTPRVRKRSFRAGQDYYVDLSVSALPRPDGLLDEAIGIFTDISAISRMREKLDAIDAAGRELVALDADATALLDVGERLRLLESNLIRYCRELLHFTHFGVLVLDPATSKLEWVLAGGFSEQAKSHALYARKEGHGISGYVAATGQAYVCRDVARDPLYIKGLEAARSSLTVPLRLNDRVVGVLNVESDEPAAFAEEDRQIAEIFARYIAVALHTLKLLAAERSETTGQVTADVAAELAAPLNDIVAEASRLMAEPQGPEETRGRLCTIIGQVDRAKKALQAMRAGPAIRGLVPEPASDPVLKDKRVLVADDEDTIRETIADVLTKVGALAITARHGAEAVAMVQSQCFDVIVSDIKMPHKNGYEVFAAAQQARRGCPVILITGFGYDPEHSIVRASREGLAGVLFKPFKVEQLLECVRKALGGAAPHS